jgi:hypothetical protein
LKLATAFIEPRSISCACPESHFSAIKNLIENHSPESSPTNIPSGAKFYLPSRYFTPSQKGASCFAERGSKRDQPALSFGMKRLCGAKFESRLPQDVQSETFPKNPLTKIQDRRRQGQPSEDYQQ